MPGSIADTPKSRDPPPVYDIEHVPVDNDPREWTPFQKNFTLVLISSAAMIAGLAGNIQNPAVQEMRDSIGATDEQFSLSISLFILLQGAMPLAWTAISEVKGRKVVYLVSLALFTLSSMAVALSPNMNCVIGFRCLQAAGSSAVIAIGASTLADIFDPKERGTKVGIFYIAPLLGPALGPILGGALTTGFGWRAIFWFLTIIAGISCVSFLLFKDTYRKERSLLYQKALKARLKHLPSPSSMTVGDGTRSPGEMTIVDPEKGEKSLEDESQHNVELELKQVNLSLRDLNPFRPIWFGLRRPNNVVILFASGLSFAFNYMVSYTAARTLGFNYGYNPLKIGLVTLAFGIGCTTGSVISGRFSDYSLAKLKEANGGVGYPEMRLKSTIMGVIAAPPFIVVLGWLWQEKVHISAVCVIFFFNGFFFIWPYTSALAYIVDSNKGRSSTAVATNSAFRGVFAFVATEVAVPMQDTLGDGWMITLWAFLILISGMLMLLTYWRGKSWRESAEAREARESME